MDRVETDHEDRGEHRRPLDSLTNERWGSNMHRVVNPPATVAARRQGYRNRIISSAQLTMR